MLAKKTLSLPCAIVVLLAALLSPLGRAAPIQSPLQPVETFGANPGELRMYKYVPAGLPAGRPLVVALHGCRQDASNYAVGTGWVNFAEKWRFALLLPEQTAKNNKQKCFNWFNGANPLDILALGSDIDRGEGEAASIRSMIDQMIKDHAVDRSRIYVTGLSAGAAMTVVMLAAYPEMFASGAPVAGIPYKCTTATMQATSCMKRGKNRTPKEWGDLVREVNANFRGPWPTLSIWQGDMDNLVSPNNAEELVKQWTNVHGVDQKADKEETVKSHFHRVYTDNQGRPRVELWAIRGMGHGVPIDPGEGDDQCGTSVPFLLPQPKICASYYIGKFWGLDRAP